ncbi:hypothetical protein Sps_00983 [Shewanella psychrophila]|uniref:Uncharacterized protein n=1 Tax=Shewanella psychrophila TaxID=225848 RepID=A0A1S6HKY8_9GAMM|nr:hypothetical protein [Shewanella psychrophila]AQS36172.1 hypothetical protein Sps_00983 [Shewanella psychrophila]
MNNQIDMNRVRRMSLPSVEARHESDPDIRRRFESCLVGGSKGKDKKASESISDLTKSLLSHNGGIYRHGSTEVVRQGEMLSYRLLNGPMMGLVIQASYHSLGIRLQIYPKNQRQSRVLACVLPNLSQALEGRRFEIGLELMPVKK